MKSKEAGLHKNKQGGGIKNRTERAVTSMCNFLIAICVLEGINRFLIVFFTSLCPSGVKTSV